ncbi:glycosyltransferase family 2 protein [Loktanella sp. TSTF-M6]|uniref:Glycosyltransferase family 2 protein n=1 Tax=Loktanella gaetbuli TaxID=2881335 RepID=A0ABS8BU54_9RHOB|nr:glycosyltransferase family 2 protein [Loktanella gaetbuli]MCB5199265.1 glycosyltransferase family 2 protein [Loktanella gaetbuli]
MLPASVVVVSHGRPDALRRCLTGLAQIDYPDVEVIVVADATSAPAVMSSGLADVIRLVRFDTPNISAARNAGVAQSTGDLIAFIDDDAVPEPRWLSHLLAPLQDGSVTVAGGFVRGRNGISFQWRGRMVFGDGQAVPLPVKGDRPVLVQGSVGRAAKTEGTNMAVRRDALMALGGFDPAFEFYLDETDVNLRLAARGAVTALVPLAQVHHGYAASPRRTAGRVPRNLFQIGASLAVFLRKHGPTRNPSRVLHRAEQRRRLLGHMVAGHMMPGDVRRILATFDAGWAAGMTRPLGQIALVEGPRDRLRFPTTVRPHDVMSGRFWQASRLRDEARARVSGGAVVTLYLFSFSGLFHRVRFTDAGVWEQSGGQFGRSDRDAPILTFVTARARSLREAQRVHDLRVPQVQKSNVN